LSCLGKASLYLDSEKGQFKLDEYVDDRYA
jgi:hypothetical protein